MGQMANGCIHLRDCARPPGLDADVSLEDWRMVLDWLAMAVAGRRAALGDLTGQGIAVLTTRDR